MVSNRNPNPTGGRRWRVQAPRDRYPQDREPQPTPAPAAGAGLARAAGAVFIVNLASRALGFVRDMVIASAYGATPATDAFMVAYTLPYLLQSVLGMAFITVMVPVVTASLAQDREQEAWYLASGIFNRVALLLVAVTAAGIAFTPQLISLMAPGFAPGQAALAGELTRIMFPSLVLVGLGMLLTGILNACRVFALPAAAPAAANLLVILAVVLAGRRFWIHSLAWGTLLGFVAFFLIQWPALRRLGFRYVFTWAGDRPEVGRVVASLLPVALATSINQIYLAINRALASGLDPGRITALDLANRVLNLPIGIVAAAIATVIFPVMASQAAAGRKEELARASSAGLGLVFFLSLPVTVGMMVLASPLIQLLFGRGAFGAGATALTATALLYFALGLPALAAKMLITRTYYALGRYRVPLATGLASVAVDIGLSWWWLPILGHGGLALANSVAATFDLALLLWLVRRYLPTTSYGPVLFSLTQTIVASLVMGVLVGRLVQSFPPPAGSLALLLWVAAAALLGAAIFLLSARILRVPEISLLTRSFFSRPKG
ncbi:MAG: murein biosynthesis integral membrane protein MurJ [Clostridia bacterium]|nr:MAG: murein biosynthesis integral membrane protein MurJ [Clostridia bacterium]